MHKSSTFETKFIIRIIEVELMANNLKVTLFLKECIADAILKLLEEKPIEKITASEIAELAGVGRATFFRYFKNKREPLIFKLNKLWLQWAEKHQVTIRDSFDPNNGKTFFEYQLSIKPITSLLYHQKLEGVLFEAIQNIMTIQHKKNPFEYFKNSFYSYALFGIIDAWIKRGYCETPEEMMTYIKKILENPISSCL